MPTNKHAAFRYRVLDTCFRRPRHWTIAELVEEVSTQLREAFGVTSGVKERMLRYDISLMRSDPPRGFGAPIVCRNGQYFYSDPNFSIEKKPLTADDIHTLQEALGLLQQFNGLPHMKALKEMIVRIGGWAKGIAERAIIQFETNEQVQGSEWIGALYAAALEERAVCIDYHPFILERASTFIFHPYLLKEYRNRWFCLGLNEAEGKVHTLAWDRIRHVELSQRPFIPNTFFDPQTYFQDIVGVSRPDDGVLTAISFETTPLLSRYLETKPIHRSQRLVQRSEQRALFQIEVIPNQELYAEFRRFGRAARIVAPEWVQAAVLAPGGWGALPEEELPSLVVCELVSASPM